MRGRAEKPLSERNPWKWILAFILAVASHGVWLFWLDTTWALPRDRMPPTPEWTLVTLSGETTGQPLADLLYVWSPSAFALPTSLGFSRALITEEIRLRPPLQSPSETSMLLDRTHVHRDAAPAVVLPRWEQLRSTLDAEALRLPTPPAQPGPDRTPPPPAPRVAHMESVAERAAERMTLPEGIARWGTSAWSAELSLNIDEWGVVTGVIMEQRAPSEAINAQLLRGVYAWRWEPADRTDRVRVRVVYHGAPNASPPSGEAR